MGVMLRPRQVQAVVDLRQAYSAGCRAPILVAPTGFGKTATAAQIVRLCITRGRSAWFLAHLREILDDTSGRLTAAGIPHGSIRAGMPAEYHHLVQVVAVQTAVRRPQLPRPHLIIIDECHLAVAKSYQQVIAAAGHPLLLGLTGTPQRLDSRGLREVFDLLVPTCSTTELIAEQLLAPVRVFAPPGADLSGIGRRAGDFDQGQAGAVMSRPSVVGDALSHWQKLCAGRRGVAFTTTVAHAEAVAHQWREAGYRAMAVHGGSDDAERREAIAGLRAGRLDLVACAQLWIAGVDVPEIDAVIWLRPTASLTAWLQGNGRGLRIAPGKHDLLVLDHVGNVARLGHPLQVHEWTLDGKVGTKREQAPSVKVCPKCFCAMASAARACPECGHEFVPERRELQHVDGELVEVDHAHGLYGKFQVGDVVCETCAYDTGKEVHFVVLAVRKSGMLKVTYYGEDSNGEPLETGNRMGFEVKGANLTLISRPDPVRERRREQARAGTLEELVAVGQRRGMKNPTGWARHVMAARSQRRGPTRVVGVFA